MVLPALIKLVPYLIKRLTGRQWDASDREIPLGPFLGLAAITLLEASGLAAALGRGISATPSATIEWLVRYLLGWDG